MLIKHLKIKSFSLRNYKDVSGYIIGEILTKGIYFLSIPLFTYLLTPSEYGLVSVFVLLQPFLTLIIGFNIPGYVRQNILKNESSINVYLGNILPFITIITILFVLLVIIFSETISGLLGLDVNSTFILVFYAISQIYFQVYLFLLLGQNRSLDYAKITAIYAFLNVSISLILISLFDKNHFMERIVGIALASIIISCYAIFNLMKIASFKLNWEVIKLNLHFSLPLLPHSISGILLSQIDRIIILKIVGEYATGLYSFAYNIGMVIMLIIVAINNSWLPTFYSLLSKGDYETINNRIRKYFKFILIFSLFTSLTLPLIVKFIVPKEYHESIQIIPLIIVSGIFFFLYTVYANYIFYHGRTYYVSIGTFMAGGINIVLNLIFIPIAGYKIAAVTTIFSYITLFVFIYIITKRTTNYKMISLKNLFK